MFEGLGPFAHSAHTQFYNIEAFSSQKVIKCSYFLNFPRFPPDCREKIMTLKKKSENYFSQTGKKATSVVSEPRSDSGSLGPIRSDFARKKCFCTKSTTRK